MSREVSNEELDNARHQMEFCFDRFIELEPLLRQIVEARTESKTLFDLYRNKVQTEQFSGPFDQILVMTIVAQVQIHKIIRKEDWKVNFSTRSIALAYLGHFCPILVSLVLHFL